MAVTAIVGAVAAYAIASSRPVTYTATSVLQIRGTTPEENITGSGSFEDSASQQRSAATLAAVAESRPIVQDVVRRLDDRFTADQVLRRIEIVADTDANVLRLDATDQSPRTAARLANVYAGAFIERQQTRERATASSARRRLEERYRQLSRGARRGGVGRTLRDQIERLRTLELVGTGTVSLVEEAVAPTTSNQNLLRTGLLGGLFGLLLGAGLALLRDQFDRRIRSGDDLEELLGVPLLAQIPDSRNLAHARPVDELKPAEFEGFRMLWTGLRFAADGSEMRPACWSPPRAPRRASRS